MPLPPISRQHPNLPPLASGSTRVKGANPRAVEARASDRVQTLCNAIHNAQRPPESNALGLWGKWLGSSPKLTDILTGATGRSGTRLDSAPMTLAATLRDHRGPVIFIDTKGQVLQVFERGEDGQWDRYRGGNFDHAERQSPDNYVSTILERGMSFSAAYRLDDYPLARDDRAPIVIQVKTGGNKLRKDRPQHGQSTYRLLSSRKVDPQSRTDHADDTSGPLGERNPPRISRSSDVLRTMSPMPGSDDSSFAVRIPPATPMRVSVSSQVQKFYPAPGSPHTYQPDPYLSPITFARAVSTTARDSHHTADAPIVIQQQQHGIRGDDTSGPPRESNPPHMPDPVGDMSGDGSFPVMIPPATPRRRSGSSQNSMRYPHSRSHAGQPDADVSPRRGSEHNSFSVSTTAGDSPHTEAAPIVIQQQESRGDDTSGALRESSHPPMSEPVRDMSAYGSIYSDTEPPDSDALPDDFDRPSAYPASEVESDAGSFALSEDFDSPASDSALEGSKHDRR